MKEGTIFAGGLWTWTGFVPHNAYSIQAGKAATQSCFDHRVKDVIYTAWGDNGGECSRYSILPSMFYNACIAHGVTDEEEIKQKFASCFDIEFDDFMLIDLPNTRQSGNNCPNPDKHMLYNDCFLGKFDFNVSRGDGALYQAAGERLAPLTKHPQFGYVFETIKTICEVLAVKFELGVRSREAYLKGDKKALENILSDYELTIERVEKFYEAFRKQWLIENKPHGMDCHDARIGALIHRIKSCQRRIGEYLGGSIDRIEEIEEPVLDVFCQEPYEGDGETRPICYMTWSNIISANII